MHIVSVFNRDGIHSYFVETVSETLCSFSLSCLIVLHIFSTCDRAFSPDWFNQLLLFWACENCQCFCLDGKFTLTLLQKFLEFCACLVCLAQLDHIYSPCEGAFSPVNSFFFKYWACANCQCFKWWWKIHSYVVKEVSGICAHSICLAQLDLIYSNRDGAFSLVNSTSCYYLGLCTLSVFLIVTEFTPTLLKQFLKLCARSVYLA